jgi:hypothetical protein
LAVNVPDLDAWIVRFEVLLGPGFERATVQQATGPVEIAIHPAGVELVAADSNAPPSLRSFHLATADVDEGLNRAASVGWKHTAGFEHEGRRHEVVNASGLRLLLLETHDDDERGGHRTTTRGA